MPIDGLNLYQQFIALHKPQLEASNVPEHFWPTIYRKVSSEIFDAGEVFQLMLLEYDDDEDEGGDAVTSETAIDTRPSFLLSVMSENGVKAQDPNAIFLIDHALTFRMNTVREQITSNPNFLFRICAMLGLDSDDENVWPKIWRRMWRCAHFYSLMSPESTPEERLPIWYIMDEVGSAIAHSDEPNFRVVPFICLTNGLTYSLLYPLQDCETGDRVTHDFVPHVARESLERQALLLPWQYKDLSDCDFKQVEPTEVYFLSGHIPEQYSEDKMQPLAAVDRNEPIKVYATYDIVRQYLNSPCFELVDDEGSADVLWLTQHFKDFNGLSSHKMVNQFPYEYVITIKDLLAIVCRRRTPDHHNPETLETYPQWLPTTYNLKTELVEFVSYFQNRAAKGLDNHWIIKPWNLARGLDTHISNNLPHIVRLRDTGPKIAQKYIEHPVLFYREDLSCKVKFDIRYVLLVKSFTPLEAYVHRKFFLRFANKEFTLDNFDEYEKHFTVMNYHEEVELRHIKCEEFVELWQEQYPNDNWLDIEAKICHMLHEMLLAATQSKAPCGIAPCAQSRALYAADIMLEWAHADSGEMQPKLLEVNYTPDCKRACEYYPEFFNDVFKLLFLDIPNDESFRLLE